MLHFQKRFAGIALVSLLFGAGCSSPTPSGSSATATPPAVAPTSAVASDCAFGFFPFKQGYEITYQTSGGGLPTHTLDERVTALHDNQADIAMQSDGRPISDQHYRCDHGHVQALSYLDPSFLRSGENVKATTDSVTGDWLPSDMTRIGATSDMDARGAISLNLSGMEHPTTIPFTVHMHRTIVDQEDVTVPAGTYHATKIQVMTTLTTGASGAAPPFENTEWWVNNVGLVKSVMQGGPSGAFQEEATRIVIPS